MVGSLPKRNGAAMAGPAMAVMPINSGRGIMSVSIASAKEATATPNPLRERETQESLFGSQEFFVNRGREAYYMPKRSHICLFW